MYMYRPMDQQMCFQPFHSKIISELNQSKSEYGERNSNKD